MRPARRFPRHRRVARPIGVVSPVLHGRLGAGPAIQRSNARARQRPSDCGRLAKTARHWCTSRPLVKHPGWPGYP